VLEHHQVARMRRGPGGGLFVAEPGVEAVTEAVALQVDRLGMQPSHLFELRTAVELAIVELAVKRLTDDAADTLRRAVECEQHAGEDDLPVVGHDVHGVLAGLVDNPVLELVSLVLIRLTRLHQVPIPGADSVPRADLHKAHAAIVKAITERDGDLARRRMQRHLGAMAAWVR
jgi:DNA-binding FadR family transcriptional regulator